MVGDRKELLNLSKEASQLIAENAAKGKRIRVTSHHDADGLASASILSLFLRSLEANFSVRVVQQLEDDVLRDDIFALPADLYVFSDLGSGQKPLISELRKEGEVVIIDHHQLARDDDEHILEVNPYLCGFDGSTEACGATLAYLVASQENGVNGRAGALACVGAIGDRLDRGEKRSFRGLNEEIFEDLSKHEKVDRSLGLCLFGFETRPVVKCLEYTTDPLLPGLTGSESSSFAFMKKIGVEPVDKENHWRTLSELSESELQRLTSSLVKYLISKGVRASVAESLIGYVYTIRGEERGSPLRDAREFASLLNACGRLDRPGVGLAIAMGDRRQHYAEAQGLLVDYRKKIGEYMDWLTSHPTAIQRKGSVTCLFGHDKINEKIIGTVTSLALSSQLISEERPVLAFAESENDKIKVSSRVAPSLIEKGINLGEALRVASESVGGSGGGHPAAAGAMIPQGSESDFIEAVESALKAQLHSQENNVESDLQAAV